MFLLCKSIKIYLKKQPYIIWYWWKHNNPHTLFTTSKSKLNPTKKNTFKLLSYMVPVKNITHPTKHKQDFRTLHCWKNKAVVVLSM